MKTNILLKDKIAIIIIKMNPASIIHRPIVERSLKNIHTKNPKIIEKIEDNNKPCLSEDIFCFISLNNFEKLNLVDSIEGLFSLFVLIYLHLLDSKTKIVKSKNTIVIDR